MYKVSRILTLVAAAGALQLLSLPAQANCDNADRCTIAQCNERRAKMSPACTYKQTCTDGMSLTELQAVNSAMEPCINAVLAVNKCFSKGNPDLDPVGVKALHDLKQCTDLILPILIANPPDEFKSQPWWKP